MRSLGDSGASCGAVPGLCELHCLVDRRAVACVVTSGRRRRLLLQTASGDLSGQLIVFSLMGLYVLRNIQHGPLAGPEKGGRAR